MEELFFIDEFHSIALAAYMLEGAESGQWPPDCEATKKRAYDMFNAEKGKKK